MGFEKDLCLIILVISMIFYYIKSIQLKRKIHNQRKFFINTLSHDFRVSVIAQIRALEILQKTESLSHIEKYNLIKDIKCTSSYTLDMVTMLMNVYKAESGENICISEKINIKVFTEKFLNSIKSSLDEKCLKIDSYLTEKSILADSKYLTKIFKLIMETVISYSKRNSIITIYTCNNSRKFYLTIDYEGVPISSEEKSRMVSGSCNFSTVGYGIQMYFCNKFLKFNKGDLKFKTGANGHNQFIISLPICKNSGTISSKSFNFAALINNFKEVYLTNFNINNYLG